MDIVIRPGECFRIAAFTDAQLEILYDEMVRVVSEEHGGGSGESLGYAKRNIERYPYFGIDHRDITTYTWRYVEGSEAFTTDITNQLIEEFNRMTTTTTAAATMFPVGTCVVPNGFRYSKQDSTEHQYGTNTPMERWERDKTVLTVVSSSEVSVRARENNGPTATYHLSELRLATPEEQTVPEVFPRLGDIVKDCRGVYLVTSDFVDSDGDLRVQSMTGPGTDYLRVKGSCKAEYVILGRFNAEGAFEPAAAQEQHTHSDPVTWKKGQSVRCISDDQRYITKGYTYTLTEDVSYRPDRSTVRIRIKDNDGDNATYPASFFIPV